MNSSREYIPCCLQKSAATQPVTCGDVHPGLSCFPGWRGCVLTLPICGGCLRLGLAAGTEAAAGRIRIRAATLQGRHRCAMTAAAFDVLLCADAAGQQARVGRAGGRTCGETTTGSPPQLGPASLEG